MTYEYIAIPACWISSDIYKNINLEKKSINLDNTLLVYSIPANKYVHMNTYHHNSDYEYICNSQEEFIERVKLSKLENLL